MASIINRGHVEGQFQFETCREPDRGDQINQFDARAFTLHCNIERAATFPVDICCTMWAMNLSTPRFTLPGTIIIELGRSP